MEESVWQISRQKTVGGSEVSSVLGVNPYQSVYSLWLRKTGRSPPVEENKYMRAGKALEPVIVQLWQQETGYQIQEGSEENTLYYHPEYPFISGTPDRIYINSNNGENIVQTDFGVLECKNTRISIETDNFPKHWWCQLQYYMGLTSHKQGEIAWLYQGVDLFHKRFEFSPEFWAHAVEQVVYFWRNYIEKDTPPPAAGHDLDHLFPRHIIGDSVIATDSTMQLVQKLHELRREKSELILEEEKAIDQIKLIMRDSEALMSPDNKVLATWKTNKASRRILLLKS